MIQTFGEYLDFIEHTGFEEHYIAAGIYMRDYLECLLDYFLSSELKKGYTVTISENEHQKTVPVNKNSPIYHKICAFESKYKSDSQINKYIACLHSIRTVANTIAHLNLNIINNPQSQILLKNEIKGNFHLLEALSCLLSPDLRTVKICNVVENVTDHFLNKKVRLKSFKTEKYVTAGTDKSTDTDVVATASVFHAQSWEEFTIIKNPHYPNTISIRTFSGNYLSANMDKPGAPLTNSTTNSSWEAFMIYERKGRYYFVSEENKKVVTVDENNNLCAATDNYMLWEEFSIEAIEKL